MHEEENKENRLEKMDVNDWDQERTQNVRLQIDSYRKLGPNFETKDPYLRIMYKEKTLSNVEIIVHLCKFCTEDELQTILSKIDTIVQRNRRVLPVTEDQNMDV